MDNPESGFTPEYESREPTSQELAEACADVLDPQTCEEIGGIGSLEDAIGFVFSALMEAGVNDPETFLVEKGILLE